MPQPPALKTGFLTRWILPLLPMKERRTALLASFASAYGGCDPNDLQVVESFNQAMTLAQYPSALMLPMRLSSLIWKDTAGTTEWVHTVQAESVEDAQVTARAHTLVEALPDSAVYGDVEEMVHDFSQLLRHCISGKPRVDFVLA
jgi:hypothetical protein